MNEEYLKEFTEQDFIGIAEGVYEKVVQYVESGLLVKKGHYRGFGTIEHLYYEVGDVKVEVEGEVIRLIVRGIDLNSVAKDSLYGSNLKNLNKKILGIKQFLATKHCQQLEKETNVKVMKKLFDLYRFIGKYKEEE